MKMEKALPEKATAAAPDRIEETPFETVAGFCSVLVVGLFILTFLGQNFVIPSGSMEETLLVGDHVLVDRITLSPSATWMPLVHYREPQRGDVVVFLKPVADMVNGQPTIQPLVKRLVGVPGDRIHLHNGIVILNGVAQSEPHAQPSTPENHVDFLDEFPSVPPDPEPGNFRTSWAARCSTTGRSRHRTNRRSRRGWEIVLRGWAMWRCTFSVTRGGRGRCIWCGERQLSGISCQWSVPRRG